MISVSVPTHKRANYLEVCLRSILTQTLLPDEIVVSEDGRDPATNEVIQTLKAQYPTVNVRHIINEPALGQLANRQQAFKLTSGDFVTMLDNDDSWHADFLE